MKKKKKNDNQENKRNEKKKNKYWLSCFCQVMTFLVIEKREKCAALVRVYNNQVRARCKSTYAYSLSCSQLQWAHSTCSLDVMTKWLSQYLFFFSFLFFPYYSFSFSFILFYFILVILGCVEILARVRVRVSICV